MTECALEREDFTHEMARVRPAQSYARREYSGYHGRVCRFQSNGGLVLLYGGVSHPRQALPSPLRAIRIGCLRRGVGTPRNHRQTQILTMPRQKLTAQLFQGSFDVFIQTIVSGDCRRSLLDVLASHRAATSYVRNPVRSFGRLMGLSYRWKNRWEAPNMRGRTGGFHGRYRYAQARSVFS
jgi:hypothetical protein